MKNSYKRQVLITSYKLWKAKFCQGQALKIARLHYKYVECEVLRLILQKHYLIIGFKIIEIKHSPDLVLMINRLDSRTEFSF